MGERSARGGRRRSEGGSGEQGCPEVDWDRVRELTLDCARSSDAQPKPGSEIFPTETGREAMDCWRAA